MDDVREAIRRVASGGSPVPVAAILHAARRQRKHRFLRLSLLGSAASLLVVGAVGAWVVGREDPRSKPPAAQPSPVTTSPGTEDQHFFPPAQSNQKDRTLIHLVFADGTEVDATYPSALRIERLPMSLIQSGGLNGDEPCRVEFDIAYHDETFFRGAPTPEAVYSSSSGEDVELWEAPTEHPSRTFLLFRFGAWRVGIDQGSGCIESEEERQAWVDGLHGHETDEGFLVLEAISPVFLEGMESDTPPQLLLGRSAQQPSVVFSAAMCEPFLPADGFSNLERRNGLVVSRSRGRAVWCDAEDEIIVEVEGTERFVEDAIAGLDVVR